MALPFIAILRGGYTGESVISHQSAGTMMNALDASLYEAAFITVEKAGWTCERADGSVLPFDRGAFTADRGHGHERFHAALVAIHGTPGEDGKLQGYLDMLGVPYQTGGVLNMALTMSKYATTGLLRQMGFPVAGSVLLRRGEADMEQRVMEVAGIPCFVKPDNSGSSLGISKVKTKETLQAALDLAFSEADSVMCEAFVQGRELTCGVIRMNGTVQAMPVCEIRTSREFFDYEAKYHAADTQEIVPAPLPDAVTAIVQARSEDIYRALQCNGMVRVDHFWKEGEGDGTEVVTIEVNTVPGFSSASIFPKMLNAAGIGVPKAVNVLVADMLLRRDS